MEAFTPDRLHVVADPAASGWLCKAAADQGMRGFRARNLVDFHSGLCSVGRIGDIAAPDLHYRWLEAHAPGLVRFTGCDDTEDGYAARDQDLWGKLRAWSGPIALWHASRNVAERSFLLAYLSTVPRAAETEVVDVSRATPAAQHAILGTRSCTGEMLVAAFLSARCLTSSELEAAHAQFEALNAVSRGVRVFDADELLEAPIDVHDERLLAFMSREWRSTVHVVGDLYVAEMKRGVREVEYPFVLWRLAVLGAQGRITRRGESEKPLFEDDPLKGEVRRTD